jgi:methyl-accepting chemotaxis protein
MSLQDIQGTPARPHRGWSVRASILGAVAAASLSGLVAGGVSLIQIDTVTTDGALIYSNSLLPARDISVIQGDLWQARWALRSASAVPDPAGKASFRGIFSTAKTAIDAAAADYRSQPISSAQRATLETFVTNWNDYLALTPQADQLAAAGKMIEQQKFIKTTMNPKVDAAVAALDQLTSMSNAMGEQRLTSARQAGTQARWSVAAVMIVGTILAVLLALRVAGSIIRPLRRVHEVLDAVADGDLTQSVDVRTRNEIGQMADALSRATYRIRAMITTLAASSTALAARSGELRSASRIMATAAEQASSQAATISSAATDVSTGIQSVAGGATQMGAAIQEIAASAQEAATVAAEAVTVAHSTDAIMSRLGTSSDEIDNVIKLITAIAEQTNLLALNATIEAARAGDAGKGFAVVASEVKDLAQETAKATDDISRRVAAIQTDTTAAADSISGVSDVITQISGFQGTIASAVEEQSVTTNGMARDLETASNDASRISAGIGEVLRATDAARSEAHSVAEAATHLATMSTELHAAVATFRH